MFRPRPKPFRCTLNICVWMCIDSNSFKIEYILGFLDSIEITFQMVRSLFANTGVTGEGTLIGKKPDGSKSINNHYSLIKTIRPLKQLNRKGRGVGGGRWVLVEKCICVVWRADIENWKVSHMSFPIILNSKYGPYAMDYAGAGAEWGENELCTIARKSFNQYLNNSYILISIFECTFSMVWI